MNMLKSNGDVWIVSTMTDSIAYTLYSKPVNKNDAPQITGKITIRGGRGLPSNRSGFGERREDGQGMPLWVADGIVTKVTAANYAVLKEHPHFIRHLAAGRLRILNEDITGNHQKVRKITRDMEGADSHALLNKDTHKQRVKVRLAGQGDQDDFRI